MLFGFENARFRSNVRAVQKNLESNCPAKEPKYPPQNVALGHATECLPAGHDCMETGVIWCGEMIQRNHFVRKCCEITHFVKMLRNSPTKHYLKNHRVESKMDFETGFSDLDL